MKQESSNPLYLQIKTNLMDKIQSGEFSPGDKLPTEDKLQKEFKVSRATIRHALDEMENEEVIKRQRGVGTIVRHKRIKPEMMKLTGFSKMMIARGMKPQTKIIKLEIVETPKRVKESFGDQESAKSWFIKRLLIADGKPIGLQDLYLPPRLNFSPEEFYAIENRSFYEILATKHNIHPTFGSESLTAVAAKKADAALLQINEGEPLLDIWRITSDENEDVFEVCHILYIADRYEYQIKLSP